MKAKGPNPDVIEQRRRYLSEAFHTLNQPLTGLHCGVELALQRALSTEDYQRRLRESLAQADEIMAIVRAIRELAEAVDPGERCGTVGMNVLLAHLENDLEVVTVASQVAVEIYCRPELQLRTDPGKFLRCLGWLVASEVEETEPGGRVRLEIVRRKSVATIRLERTGQRKSRDPEQTLSLNDKLGQIRRSAAISYIWTMGGTCETHGEVTTIRLTVQA